MRTATIAARPASRANASWGPATDAPTFLSPDEATTDQDLPPAPRGSRPRSASVITSAPRPVTQPTAPRSGTRTRTRMSTPVSMPTATPLPPPPPAPEVCTAAAPEAVAAEGGDEPELPQLPPYLPMDGGGASFDPHALPLPPELAPSVYDWLRRLALQTALPGADRLLRDALADLTSSLEVLVIYNGPDGLHTLGATDELPADKTPIVTVARARRALVATHVAFLPIATQTETIAVLQLVRNPRQQAFSMLEHLLMAAIARECAAIMHHLITGHLQRRSEAEQDKKGLYRPEALESHRRRGHEGVIAELSPGWVRRTYQVLVAAIVLASIFAYAIHVPTYSSGTGVVMFDGTSVTSPAPGTIDEVYVQPGQHVREGDVLVKLKSEKEESDLEQARRELHAAQQQYLIDNSDESLKKTLISAQGQAKRAEDALEQKTVRAPVDGTVSDVRIRGGSALEFGAPILTIVSPGTEPELWAYLPGSDRPRLRAGQTLQIELVGYQKTREQATIYDVGRTIIGIGEAKRALGAEVADALKLAQDGNYVLVKAKLPRRTFRARGRAYNFHPGMPAKTEVRVESKRFIVTLLPSLEKYVE